MKSKLINKCIAAVATACMIVGVLAGCGSSAASGTASSASSTQTTASSASEAAASMASSAASMAEIKTGGEGKKLTDLKIGVSWKTMQEARWVTELEALQKYCDDNGINMIYKNSENDSQKQVSQIEDMIAQGVDMLICIAPEKGAVDNALKKAHEAGIFVCYYERVDGETYFDFNGGNDYYDVGKVITQAVAEKNPTGDVVYLLGDAAGGTGVINFEKGMKDGMADCDVNIVGEQNVQNWDAATGMGYVENWISQYGDKLSAVLCMNDGLAGGAIQALENAGLAGKVLVCGQDCDLAACQRIVQGTQLSTVKKGGADFATKFIDTAVKYYTGEITAEEVGGTDTNSLGETKPFMSYPATLITKDNIDKEVIDAGVYTHDEVYNAASSTSK